MQVHFAASIRRLFTIALVALMAITSLVSSASAQNQSVQSSLTGVTISYGGGYQLSDDGRYSDDVMETMMFVGPADILAIGFMSPLVDLNAARDIMLQSLFGEVGTATTIDRGDYTGVSYSLDMLNLDGFEMGAFTLFMNQRAHGYSEFYIFLAPPAYFGTAMQTAQNSFTIDGAQLMNGVDATVMGNMVTANIGTTGGTTVTDVSDVTDNTSGDTGTTSTDTGTTQTGSTGDEQSYLDALSALYQEVDGSLNRNAQAFKDVSDGVLTVEEGADIIFVELEYLAGTNGRVAELSVPASMQDFHNQQVVPWAEAITAAGTTWFTAVEGGATQDQAIDAINNAGSVQAAFGPVLEAEIDSASSSDTGGTSTTQTNTTTTSTTTPSDPGDSSSYIETIQAQRLEFMTSFGEFNDHLGLLSEGASDATVTQVRADTTALAEYWTTFPSIVAQTQAPAGMESVHAAYVEWADQVAELGYLWIEYMNVGQRETLDIFFDHTAVLQIADDNLQTEITAANSASSDNSGEATESTTGSRTTRGSSTSETETTETETSGSGSRTTRGGNSTVTETPDTNGNESETSGRSSRTSSTPDDEEEEAETTSGRTTRGGNNNASSADNEWVTEVFGVSITWSDDFDLNPNSEDPQVSNFDEEEDFLALITTTPNGDNVALTLTVFGNSGSDSTGAINALVNDPALVEDLYGAGAEVVDYEITDDASAVVIFAEDEIGPYYIYVQFTCVSTTCDTLALLIVPADGYPLVDGLAMLETDLAVDGTSVSSLIPSSDIENLVDEYGG